MRTFVAIVVAAILLGGCAVVGAVSAIGAADNYKKCAAEIKATPEVGRYLRFVSTVDQGRKKRD